MRGPVIQIVAILMYLFSLPASAFMLEGVVVGVADGDTLTILDAGKEQHRVRLAQIDAPEIQHGAKKPAQAFGERSRQSLAQLTYGFQARAECADSNDQYGRNICRISVQGTDVNLVQVQRGMAWVYVQYAKDPAYFRAEAEARRARAGLWADPSPVPPWDWRKHR